MLQLCKDKGHPLVVRAIKSVHKSSLLIPLESHRAEDIRDIIKLRVITDFPLQEYDEALEFWFSLIEAGGVD